MAKHKPTTRSARAKHKPAPEEREEVKVQKRNSTESTLVTAQEEQEFAAAKNGDRPSKLSAIFQEENEAKAGKPGEPKKPTLSRAHAVTTLVPAKSKGKVNPAKKEEPNEKALVSATPSEKITKILWDARKNNKDFSWSEILCLAPANVLENESKLREAEVLNIQNKREKKAADKAANKLKVEAYL
jgi:hypothetical protein